MKTEKIFDEAISLPMEIRAQLVDRLLHSLKPGKSEIDELWATEAERRVQEIADGEVETIPGESVFKEINGRLRK